MTVTSQLDRDAFVSTLARFRDLGLVTPAETDEVLALFDPEFPYADAVAAAESIHVHVKVADVDALPHDEIRAEGVTATSCTDGYIKYPFPGGINMIFSSIDISEDDMLDSEDDMLDEPVDTPMLDHKGIDLRDEHDEVRALFDAVPERAGEVGWRHVPQGGDGQPVYCCHTEVSGKQWVYPEAGSAGQTRPIEFAFGALEIHDSKMGCDLRPIDPAHPRATEAQAALAACAASHDPTEGNGVTSSHYERGDLAHFTDVGNYAKPLMDKFWAYYNGVFGQDGALTRREKALIGLAVAHSKQCPYCIDSFTNTCADLEINPEEMHEALHAAASLGAGIDLVHGVQMQNSLKLRGAI
jgi:alkylhydroperoxidase/carboxymuconolactone decarboxylase family protein